MISSAPCRDTHSSKLPAAEEARALTRSITDDPGDIAWAQRLIEARDRFTTKRALRGCSNLASPTRP
jgi:hypothetical protein